MALKRALTLQNIVDAVVKVFDFTGEWRDAFGTPERTGVWYVFGDSGSGKTSFILMLIKCFAEFGRVLFVSYEEGEVSASLQQGIKRLGLLEKKNNVLVTTDSLEELGERLVRRKSPDFVIIDSLEYSEFVSIKQIKAFADRYPDKLFVIIGQATGKKPRTALGESVLFFAKQKIFVEGYRAFSRGRSLGETGYLTIWEKGADDYWEYK